MGDDSVLCGSVFNGVMVDWRVVVKLRLALYFLVDRLVNV